MLGNIQLLPFQRRCNTSVELATYRAANLVPADDAAGDDGVDGSAAVAAAAGGAAYDHSRQTTTLQTTQQRCLRSFAPCGATARVRETRQRKTAGTDLAEESQGPRSGSHWCGPGEGRTPGSVPRTAASAQTRRPSCGACHCAAPCHLPPGLT